MQSSEPTSKTKKIDHRKKTGVTKRALPKKKVVVGIDPGSRNFGIAWVRTDGSHWEVLDTDYLNFIPKEGKNDGYQSTLEGIRNYIKKNVLLLNYPIFVENQMIGNNSKNVEVMSIFSGLLMVFGEDKIKPIDSRMVKRHFNFPRREGWTTNETRKYDKHAAVEMLEAHAIPSIVEKIRTYKERDHAADAGLTAAFGAVQFPGFVDDFYQKKLEGSKEIDLCLSAGEESSKTVDSIRELESLLSSEEEPLKSKGGDRLPCSSRKDPNLSPEKKREFIVLE